MTKIDLLNFFRYIIYKLIPSQVYYPIAYFIKNKRLKYFNKIILDKGNFNLVFNYLKKNKNNKKIFIFGSGPSINELNIKKFKEINRYHSIGVNKWIFHKFVTNYYMIELSTDEELNERLRLRILYLLKNKKKKPFFLIQIGKSDIKKLKNWLRGMNMKRVFLYDYLRPDIFKKDLIKQFIKSFEYLSKKKSNIVTLGIGATIERSISLSLSLGYSQIVLLGVDLKNTRVFWSKKDSNFAGIKNSQEAYGLEGLHVTATKRFGAIPVQKSIKIFDKVARKFFNSKVLITTNKSLLSLKLEKYKWESLAE